MGFGMVVFAVSLGIMKIADTQGNSIGLKFIDAASIDRVLLSHWFLFSGLFLIAKGHKTTFTAFLIALAPIVFISIGTFAYTLHTNAGALTPNYLMREFVIMAMVTHRVATRLVTDIIKQLFAQSPE